MKDSELEKLFKRYYNEAMLYACSLCHDKNLAEDLVAEAFKRAFVSIDEQKDGFKYWLFKVCRNCYFDHLRQRKRLADMDEALVKDDEELVERVIKEEEYRALYRAIGMLGEDMQEAVRLYYFNGLSVKEIADILSISTENVKVKLFRARAKLKHFMEVDYEF